jgi:hypothetical protein
VWAGLGVRSVCRWPGRGDSGGMGRDCSELAQVQAGMGGHCMRCGRQVVWMRRGEEVGDGDV